MREQRGRVKVSSAPLLQNFDLPKGLPATKFNDMGDVVSTAPPTIRAATVERNTNETKIKASLALDVHPTAAPQVISVKTGIGFLDHVSGVERGL